MVAKNYTKGTERNFIFFLSILFVGLTVYILKDILSIIIYACILSYFLYPLHKYFIKKTNKNSLSSILTISSATIGLLIPLTLLFLFLVLSLLKLVAKYQEYIKNPDLLNAALYSSLETITNSSILSSFDFSNSLTSIVRFIIDYAESIFSSIPTALFNLFIILFITYYILIHHKTIFQTANHYLPLGLKKQNEILKNVQKNIQVLFRGYFLTGLIQTLVAVVGYIIFGVDNILIITFLTFITSLIPYLGSPMVWVPVGFFMIISGNSFGGIGILIYGILVISMVDNIIRPKLMSSKDTISPPLVFIGFVGGLMAFGLEGIILGPIIISITAILLKYLSENLEKQTI
jgi:predicted PurR-regulated permease PerM